MATPILACGVECGIENAHISALVVSTTTFRSGLRSIRSLNGDRSLLVALPSTTDWVIRAYLYWAVLPTSTLVALSLNQVQGVYFHQPTGTLQVGNSTSNLGGSGVSVTTGTWYQVDLKCTATTLDAQVNGTAVGQLSGTFSAETTVIFGSSIGTFDMFTDDILISQTLADYPLGAGYVLSYIPNADGTHNVAGANDFERTLTGTDITNSTTDAWTLVSERPLPTTAVDFINGIAPPNSTDYVEWQYEDSVEASAPRIVNAVFIHHDASGAGTNAFTVTLREHAGGTSANIFSGTTNVGATLTAKRAAFATVPGTSDPWTTTTFNALRSRFLVSDASPDPYIDAIMLEAEFPEVVAAARVPRFTPYPQLLAH